MTLMIYLWGSFCVRPGPLPIYFAPTAPVGNVILAKKAPWTRLPQGLLLTTHYQCWGKGGSYSSREGRKLKLRDGGAWAISPSLSLLPHLSLSHAHSLQLPFTPRICTQVPSRPAAGACWAHLQGASCRYPVTISYLWHPMGSVSSLPPSPPSPLCPLAPSLCPGMGVQLLPSTDVDIYTQIHVHTHMHSTYTHICTRTHAHLHAQSTYKHTHSHAQYTVYTQTFTCTVHTHAQYTHAHTLTCTIYTQMHSVHTNTHIHMHSTHTHTHMHSTHTHAQYTHTLRCIVHTHTLTCTV